MLHHTPSSLILSPMSAGSLGSDDASLEDRYAVSGIAHFRLWESTALKLDGHVNPHYRPLLRSRRVMRLRVLKFEL